MENPIFSRDDSLKKSSSFNYYRISEESSKSQQQSWNNEEFGFGGSDRRFAYTRQSSFRQPTELPHTPISINDSSHPFLSRSFSGIDKTPFSGYPKFGSEKKSMYNKVWGGGDGIGFPEKFSILMLVLSVFRIVRYGSRPMKRLFIMISLNVAYSTAELFIGIFTGRVGKKIESLVKFCSFMLKECDIEIHTYNI